MQIVVWEAGVGQFVYNKLDLAKPVAQKAVKYVSLLAGFVLAGQFSAIQFIKLHEHTW